MKKFRGRRYRISTIAAALALLSAAPATTLAADSAGAPTGTAAGAPDPGSTGWVPQDAGPGTPGEAAAPVRHGSSLGSDVSSEPEVSRSEEDQDSTRSSGDEEPAAPTESSFEETAVTPAATTGVYTQEAAGAYSETEDSVGAGPVEPPPAPTPKITPVAIGAATAIARSEPRGGADGTAAGVDVEPVGAPIGEVETQSSGLPILTVALLILATGALILGGLAVRLELRRRRRRQLEALWRQRDAEWKAALRGIRLERETEPTADRSPVIRKLRTSAGDRPSAPRDSERMTKAG